MNIIKKWLLNSLSDEQVELEYQHRFKEDMDTLDYDEELKNQVMSEMAGVHNIDDLLKAILKRDRVRYFNVPIESQQSVKGAFMRTLWLLKMIREQRKPERKPDSVIAFRSPRHG